MSFRRQHLLLLSFLALIFVDLGLALTPPLPQIGSSAVHLRVVHWNDVYKLDHLPSAKQFLEECRGQISDDTTRASRRVISTLGGDFCSPSLLSSMDQGRAAVSCLGDVVDYACLGNHEADHGQDAFCENVEQFAGQIINSNFPVLPARVQAKMPESVAITLQSYDGTNTRTVQLLGLLDPTPNLYLKDAFCPVAIENAIPIRDCLKQYLDDSAASTTMILPITHQDVELDQALAQELGCAQKLPIILGGHDHDEYDIVIKDDEDDHPRCRVLKAGMDAQKLIVVDIVWDNNYCQKPHISVDWVDMTARMEHQQQCKHLKTKMQQFMAPLRRLDRTVLKVLERRRDVPLTSCHVRREQTTMGALICTAVCKALQADVAILNAGSIRGNAVYTTVGADDDDDDEDVEDGMTIGDCDSTTARGTATATTKTVTPIQQQQEQQFFTFADLLNELPYSTEICVVPVPGKVLEAAVDYSRRFSGEQGGGFLQCCNKMEVVQEPNGRYKILQIRGQSLDPNKIYNVATLHHLLTGMDDIQPLTHYIKDTLKEALPPLDATRPAKELVLQVYRREIWTALGSFDDLARDGLNEEEDGVTDDVVITSAKLGAALERNFGMDPTDEFVADTFAAFDSNNDGVITRAEYDANTHAIRTNRFDLSPSDCSGIVQVMDVCRYLNSVLQQKYDNHQSDDGGDYQRISQAVEMELFSAGQVILTQGDSGDCLYFCEEGTVGFVVDGTRVGSCGEGSSFGELSLLYGTPRAATCLAADDCRLWKIDRAAFNYLLVQAANRHNERVKNVIGYLANAIQDPIERSQIRQMRESSVKERESLFFDRGMLVIVYTTASKERCNSLLMINQSEARLQEGRLESLHCFMTLHEPQPAWR